MPKRDDISKLGFLVTGDENWASVREILFELWDYAFGKEEVKEKEEEVKKEVKEKKEEVKKKKRK